MTATYTYDGNGQRVKKVVNGVTTIFHYDESGQLIAESNGSGAITAVYVYLNGQPLAKIEGTSVYYYHNDALGTPQKMTDSTGTVVWAADYKPFGEVTITVSTITNNLRFPGQYFDAETGLHQNRFRDYNFLTGRYVETDPLLSQFTFQTKNYFMTPYLASTPGKLHGYVYAMNSPIILKDILGLQASGKTCPPTTCKGEADKSYNKCMAGMKLTSNTVTVICVTGGVIAGAGATVATGGNVGAGLGVGGITIAGCFLVPDIDTLPGEIWCGFFKNKAYQACDALGEP
jgi:RHS repeat-associated protein